MTKCLVTGAGGQVGKALQEASNANDISLMCFDKHKLDITNKKNLTDTFQSIAPDIVINAAAYTDVDGAESNSELAFSVNRDGAGLLAEICQQQNIPMIHLSTDFIFDGNKNGPYLEDDQTSPLSVYGQSKLEGERLIRYYLQEHFILRTSWVFSEYGKNFVKSILQAAQQKSEFHVVDDQVGCPTAAQEIANVLIVLANHAVKKRTRWGTYHYCGTPAVSRFEFARTIIEQFKGTFESDVRVNPIASTDYPTPARRPAHADLDCSLISQAFGIEQPAWRLGLDTVCQALTFR